MTRATYLDDAAPMRKTARAFMRFLDAAGYVYSAKVPREAADRAQLIADALAVVNPADDKPREQAAAMEYDFAQLARMLRDMDPPKVRQL